MKFTTLQAVFGSAVFLFSPTCSATTGHRRLHLNPHKQHHAHRPSPGLQLLKRGQCQFPSDDNLIAVTPDAQNAGWAMSPDQTCSPGTYCPYACKPGMVMAQWDPDSTYTYPASMNGGLYCDKNGNIKKPFPDKPLCVDGTGAVKAVNKLGSPMSWCQTVLPGNEAMLIPTVVHAPITIAVPDTSYWQSTAAHFYINGPGTDASDCIWGDPSKPIGNWSPYVAGANTDASGNTFVKLGMNPIWQDSSLSSSAPSFGVRIECEGGGCQGLPCAIAPNTAKVSGGGTVGAGGAAFCVATVPKGSSANIVAYSDDDLSSGPDPTSSSAPKSSSAPSSTSKKPDAAAFAQQAEKTSDRSSTSAPPTSTADSSTTEVDSSTTAPPTSSATSTTTSDDSSETESTARRTSSHVAARPTVKPGIFHENSTSSAMVPTRHPTTAQPTASPTMTHKAEAIRHSGGGAFAGLIVAFIATAYLF